MSIKLLISFLLISSILLDDSLVPIIELPKYGEVRLYERSYLYLNLDGYKQGDEIYIILTIDDFLFTNLNDLALIICETNQYKEFNQNTRQVISDYKYMQERPHAMSYYIYYTIKLQGNFKYLVIVTPKLPLNDIHEPEIDIIKETRKWIIYHDKYGPNLADHIVLIICFIVIFISIAFLVIFFIIKRRKFRQNNNDIQQQFIAQKSTKEYELFENI